MQQQRAPGSDGGEVAYVEAVEAHDGRDRPNPPFLWPPPLFPSLTPQNLAGTKRSAEPTESARRSTRTAGSSAPAPVAKKAKATPAPKKTVAKKVSTKKADNDDDNDDEDDEVDDDEVDEPEAKKSGPTKVGELVQDVQLQNGKHNHSRTARPQRRD